MPADPSSVPPTDPRRFVVEVLGLPEWVDDLHVRSALASCVRAIHADTAPPGAGMSVGTSGGRAAGSFPVPTEPEACVCGSGVLIGGRCSESTASAAECTATLIRSGGLPPEWTADSLDKCAALIRSAAAGLLAHTDDVLATLRPVLTRQYMGDVFHLAVETEDRTDEEQEALDALAVVLDRTASAEADG